MRPNREPNKVMKRAQFIGSVATGVVSGFISASAYVRYSNTGMNPPLGLAAKEDALKALRAPLAAALEAKSRMNSRAVDRFLERAKEEHGDLALKGDASSQYLLGRCFRFAADCYQGQIQLAAELKVEAESWFTKGARSSHPACKYLTANGSHWDSDYRDAMREAILLGSVDALRDMNAIDDALSPNSSDTWMSHGPYLRWSNTGGYYDTYEEAIRYWMVFVFFTLRWDPELRYLSAGIPDPTIWRGLIEPVSEEAPSPPDQPDVAQLVKSLTWAYEQACQIKLHYLPSEILTTLW